MSHSIPSPSASLDSNALVEQWHDLLSALPRSALAASVLRGELDTLVDQVRQIVQDAAPLEDAHRATLASTGEQLVELGITELDILAQAQKSLTTWLGQEVDPSRLADLLTAFNAGAFRALQQRSLAAQSRQQQATEERLSAHHSLMTLVARFNRELIQLPQGDENAAISLALSMLMRELDGEGAGYFILRQQKWVLVQAHGTLPPTPFIQPLNEEPPLLADNHPRAELSEGQYQLAAPLQIDESHRALLLVVVGGARLRQPEDVVLEAMALLGESLGQALHNAEMYHIIQRQLAELRAMERRAEQETARSGGLRQMGMLLDDQDRYQTLNEPPDVHVTIESNRVVLPLSVRGDAIGKLVLEDDQLHEWDEDELELMNVVAEQMSQALEVARLFQESQRRAAQIAAAAEVGRAASSLLSLEELMDAAVNQIRRAFGYYHAQVFLIDDDGEWAVLRSSTGEAGKKLLERGHKLGVGTESIIGKVTSTAQPAVVRDTDRGVGDTWSFNELLPETRAELAVPLKIGATVIGALDVQSKSPDVFYEDDIAVLQTLADQMAVAIQNARAYEQQRETAEQLRELDKLKTQFLANMSHELRTPLNSIIGFSRVILKGIDGPITELQKKDLTTIYNSGQILLQLIDSILDISKIEAGKMELDFEEVDIHTVVDVALSTAVGLVKDKSVQLLKDVPADLPLIVADSVRLRQVLLNLLSNASKFTEDGHIKVIVTHVGDEMMISVQDTGLGIPPDKQEHLFEAFYQVDGSATRKVGGTGLGLAITKSFVELHGGQIWVESTGVEGEGTTFHFTIPIAGPGEESETAQEPPLVLAVDDEPGITMLYDKYLSPEGYRFVACSDPMKAVEQAATLQPNLILLDLRMPAMNGFEVLEALRQNIVTRDIPVVMCSIESINEIEDQALKAGASDFLQKPVLRQDLVSAARRWAGTPAIAEAKANG